MFSYTFYKVLHFSGIFIVLLGLGATASHILQGGTKETFKNRKFFMALHGAALTVAFIAGFGLIARAGYNFSAGWIWGKMLIWLILGAYPVVLYKKGQTKLPFLLLLGVLFTAIYLVEYKPF